MAATLEDMRRNPAGLDPCRYGGRVRPAWRAVHPPSGGGSHYKVPHSSQRGILTIPRARPVKVVYIRKLVRFIDAIGATDAPP